MGWSTQYVYGENKLKQLLESLCTFENDDYIYSLVDYAGVGFKGAVCISKVVNKKTNKEELECFGVLTRYGDDEITYKETDGDHVARCCPKKLMPLLKQCNRERDIEYYNTSKKLWKEMSSSTTYQNGCYYFNEEGIELTNGYVSKLWRVHERKVLCVGYKANLPPAKKKKYRDTSFKVETDFNAIKKWLSAYVAFTKVDLRITNGILLKVLDPKEAYGESVNPAELSPFLPRYKKYFEKYQGPNYMFVINGDFERVGKMYRTIDEMVQEWTASLDNQAETNIAWEGAKGSIYKSGTEEQLDMFAL